MSGIGDLAAFVALLAGGVAGVLYLVKRLRATGSWVVGWYDERRRVRRILSELTSPDAWPNGSATIAESHRSLYDRIAGIELAVNELATAVENALTKG